MLDSSQQNSTVTELDRDLLSTPFSVQTNWHVITGAPSCGKTTLIDQLADKGFQTTPEGGRLYIEREIASGRTIDEIRESAAALQRGIKDTQLSIEGGLRMRFYWNASTIAMLPYSYSTHFPTKWMALGSKTPPL
jgi:ABC-type molybdenum transport system ATPase subunit/photorepair protein PhrA